MFGYVFSAWLLIIPIVFSLIFAGTVYALATVLNQQDLGFLKIGETKTFTILRTNETINPSDLNLSTTCVNGQAISATLTWKDESGIVRNQPLNLGGNTSFLQKITNDLNLTLAGVSAANFNCTTIFINSSVVFLNFSEVLS